MKNNLPSLRRAALCALASALVLAVLPAAHAASASPAPVADMQAPSLPLHATIEKGAAGEKGGAFTLILKNTSDKELKASAVIVDSVTSHNQPKTHNLPEHAIAAGKEWKIADLAALDKVTVTAAGFAPLEVTVK